MTEYLLDTHAFMWWIDPFDRLLVAQAQTERLVLVTGDARIAQYDVETIW